MSYLLMKYGITAAIVVLVSEVAKRSDKFGALLSSLPLVTILVLIWLYVEQQPATKIDNHASYTFWYVLPTLPMFLVFPWLHAKLGFWAALGASAVLTAVLFLLLAISLRRFGMELMP